MKKEELLLWFKDLKEELKTAGWDDEVDEPFHEQITAIIKNQPTITKRDIENWAGEARNRVESHKNWEGIEEVLIEMCRELGVEIKNGKKN